MTTFSPNLALHQKVANCFAFVSTDMRFAYAIRATFLALPSAAMSLERITAIVTALDGVLLVEQDDVRKALALLVRNGALRSRMHGGARIWEANY